MDITVAQFFAPLDVSMIIIDCSWNMHASEITAKAPKLVAYLRNHGHATTPIVLVQGTTAGQAWIGNSSGAATGIVGGLNETANRAAMASVYEDIVAAGDKQLHFVDGDACVWQNFLVHLSRWKGHSNHLS